MMDVSAAQCQAAIDQLQAGLGDLRVQLTRIGPAARAAASRPFMPPGVADALLSVGEKLKEIGSWLLEKITELLEGAAAPGVFAWKAYEWENVRGAASGVAVDLRPEVLQAGRMWHGEAEQAYARQIPPQGAAASRVAAIADKTATSLAICAAAGAAFYVALGVIVAKFIIAMTAAIAAFGSVVFSWAGLAIVVEEAGVNTGMVIAAVATLTALLAAQAQQLAILHGEAVDVSAFPGGKWPNARSVEFSDGTVLDADADWSLRG